MSLITKELVRKRAEHNDLQIGTLEEVSLHQQDIMKIDNIQHWCKDLKILFLQSNIISKIENLEKLMKLEYLNLAINNIERIENLELCESLKKLDLTLNFIGELTSVKSLMRNTNLKELYLVGNPCSKFDKYREYIIGTLPQLDSLDGVEILPTEKIVAKQNYSKLEESVFGQQTQYLKIRQMQKANAGKKNHDQSNNDNFATSSSNKDESFGFWKETSNYTPESRLALAEEARKINRDNVVDLSTFEFQANYTKNRKIKLFKDDGCPLNVNQPKIPFTLEDLNDKIVLTVDVYKHLDTSCLDVDVQPSFVRVMIKDKILQLVLPDEVSPDKSTAKRATTSKRLVINMPKSLTNI